jgi:hypothetical protein
MLLENAATASQRNSRGTVYVGKAMLLKLTATVPQLFF